MDGTKKPATVSIKALALQAIEQRRVDSFRNIYNSHLKGDAEIQMDFVKIICSEKRDKSVDFLGIVLPKYSDVLAALESDYFDCFLGPQFNLLHDLCKKRSISSGEYESQLDSLGCRFILHHLCFYGFIDFNDRLETAALSKLIYHLLVQGKDKEIRAVFDVFGERSVKDSRYKKLIDIAKTYYPDLVLSGKIESADFLIKEGVDPNPIYRENRKLQDEVVARGSAPIVAFLEEKIFNPIDKDKKTF